MNVNDIVKRQIDALENADVSTLKARFEELYGFECGVTNAKNLRNRIAYKIQEIYFGGISEVDKAMLESIADKDPAANIKTPRRRPVKFVKGTRLCRDWKGKPHEVLVRQDGGFEYEGEIYRSLTAIAEKITGTHWNGKKFFGVK
ncbi:MAG: DUF2924 domain-containing protein [Lentisphaeria bacterium]|nr:DUF2924 domain-containing protein [Lentisphaeria bacterium]